MDLEMTGLDPVRHRIVEIATLLTDDDLTIIAEGPDLVVATSPDDLAAMDDVVRTMHTKSGSRYSSHCGMSIRLLNKCFPTIWRLSNTPITRYLPVFIQMTS